MAFIGIKIPKEIEKILKNIDVPGTKAPHDEYHITIAYFGNDWSVSNAAKTIKPTFEVLQKFKPFEVEMNFISSFPSKTDKIPIFVKVESKQLLKLNKKLKKIYDKNKIKYSKLHKKFIPHVTLSYADEKIEDQKIETIKFMASEIVIWAGDHGDENFSMTFSLIKL